MSSTRFTHMQEASPRRVRHQARDVAMLMGFSAGLSLSLALALLMITSLGH